MAVSVGTGVWVCVALGRSVGVLVGGRGVSVGMGVLEGIQTQIVVGEGVTLGEVVAVGGSDAVGLG